MKLKHLIFVLLPVLLAACAEEPSVKEKEIYAVKNIGMLSTTEYTVGKIVKLTDKSDWMKLKWGDRKILMSCKAKVKAGVDLSKIIDKDIQAKGKRIEITLPAPEIVSFEMDPDQIRTEMTDVNGMRSDFTQDEKNRIMQLGEQAIRKEMEALNILKDAENNAKAFLTDFYKELGFEEVIIHGTSENKRD